MPPRWLPVRRHLAGVLLGFAALLQVQPLAAQQVMVTSTTATTVWKYSYPGTACIAQDYSDVPVRPVLVGGFWGPTILWFAGNANGSYASVATQAGPDILAGFRRGTANGPGCVSWLHPTSYPGSTPESYNSGLWMVAPFTSDSVHVLALVHNEFHGEWTGNTSWCWLENPGSIFLPCDYWNIVSASSSNAGQSFQLRQQPGAPGSNIPAIALGKPYQVPPNTDPPPTNLPQGMTAQSNILHVDYYYYVLVQQLPYQPPASPTSPQSGVCIYRAVVPFTSGTPLTWIGWDGSDYTVAVPTSYPAGDPLPLCQPVLGAPFRFSWSFNTILNQFIIIGQDTTDGMKQNGVSLDDCRYAPGVTSTTTDSAFVYRTATLGPAGQLLPAKAETCLLQTLSIGTWAADKSNTGQAYPSLLDPASPRLVPGDLNFQYSCPLPYLYFTQLNPTGAGNPDGFDRDVVRLPLFVGGAAAAK